MSTHVAVDMTGGIVQRPADLMAAPASVDEQPHDRADASFRCVAGDESDDFTGSESRDEQIGTM